MSKRKADTPMGNKENKRKHHSLSIAKKVELLKKMDRGASVRSLSEMYNVGTSTIYDIKKQKDEILKFYAESDVPKAMENRKTLHKAKNENIDRVMMEWIRQRRSDKVPLSGLAVITQAKIFHEELKIETACEYSTGWLTKFKKRHGTKFVKICGEKASADVQAAESYVDEFEKIICDENLVADQIYNADETALYWRYVPRKTITLPEEKAPAGFKDSKERITVLGCANAAGTHKTKLMVIGKSLRPRCFKGVRTLPVHYYANKKAWATRVVFTDWFLNHFVPEARAHCRSVGLPNKCKIVLLLDNCSAHPNAEQLVKDNVFAMYLPPNVTSLIQPMDQGILRSMKCKYKNEFMRRMLIYCNRGGGLTGFTKEFTLKDAVWACAHAWNQVTKEVLQNGWHNLWPTTMFNATEDGPDDFEGFRVSSEKTMITELLEFANGITVNEGQVLDADDIEEVLNVDNDAPIVHQLTDNEIVDIVLNPEKNENGDDDDDDDDGVDLVKKVTIAQTITMCDELIHALEQRSFISEQMIMQVYMIQKTLINEQPKYMKQLKLSDIFRKASEKCAASTLENPVAGSSSMPDIPAEISPPSSPSIQM